LLPWPFWLPSLKNEAVDDQLFDPRRTCGETTNRASNVKP
jgi:hypothetical protein